MSTKSKFTIKSIFFAFIFSGCTHAGSSADRQAASEVEAPVVETQWTDSEKANIEARKQAILYDNCVENNIDLLKKSSEPASAAARSVVALCNDRLENLMSAMQINSFIKGNDNFSRVIGTANVQNATKRKVFEKILSYRAEAKANSTNE